MAHVEIGGHTYLLASLTERVIGQFLDGIAYVALLLAPAILTSVLFAPALGVSVGALLATLYLLFQDGLGAGESFGKRFIRLRVIDAQTGAPCTFWQSFIRNLLLILLSFVDWIFIFIGDRRQRLGDRAAGTVVIRLDLDI